jgi:hypothetical protein
VAKKPKKHTKRRRVRVKQRIIKALAKMASREEQGLTYIIRLAYRQYVKKARKRQSAERRKKDRSARAK